MKKNGFTLIEVLGVVILISILTLIALPKIINSIAQSGDKTNEVANKLIFNAAKLYMDDNKGSYYQQNGMNLCISIRELVDNDYLKPVVDYSNDANDITDTKSVRVTYNNGYKYELADNSTCKLGPYKAGDIIYFDPVGNSTCNPSTFDLAGIKAGTSTCYRWNVIDTADTASIDTVNIMLDHNLINKSKWSLKTDVTLNYINTSSATTALTDLATLTATWNKVPKLNYTYLNKLTCSYGECVDSASSPVASSVRARMITAEEFINIVNTLAENTALSQSWTPVYTNYFYYSRNEYKIGTSETGIGNLKLSWLTQNTQTASNSGSTFNNYGAENQGYWTLTPTTDNTTEAWLLGSDGRFGNYSITSNEYYGVRPVITISKANI